MRSSPRLGVYCLHGALHFVEVAGDKVAVALDPVEDVVEVGRVGPPLRSLVDVAHAAKHRAAPLLDDGLVDQETAAPGRRPTRRPVLRAGTRNLRSARRPP